uniref:SMP-30/Gluconolactonase/LRE-like region domain-containing protein n=1 Tax=Pyramimonas obovata TaxID=1411642 RepID=A0A7S0R5Z0_9CHLO|mmetsp:Transcript_26596/g.57871  ORF Transcript_26596/g.57871 Transcript_26596/m.57871 type:complete len:558 (+) Transcript_26596:358-2031(+)|eukprot:CAMPEP_0118934920 /NCGR_PEP_ID=MMETSP1169-20130426/14490_1 /TAXON_ID=36882 /ORGANISM="Pyramimonas obovata, Strain CCMP722" /LENGTH=557 /DNA_ID=CAMNT_0006877883 /DNA_START=358 /DNA_END=2031 /DNA_ORIENTATION=+
MRADAALEPTSLWRCRLSRILDILWIVLVLSWAYPVGSTPPPNFESVGSVVEHSGQTLQGAIGSHTGVWNAEGLASISRYFTAYGVAFSPDGQTCYVGEAYKNRVLAVDIVSGTITTVAGGNRGLQDGPTDSAKFSWPYGVALSPDATTLYVADSGNDCVRAVSFASGTVSTIAGGGAGSRGYQDGPAESSRFAWPYGVAVSPDGNVVYVADSGNNRIRSIDLFGGTVSTLAGAGIAGFQDGPSLKSRFYGPRGVAASPCGNFVYVADYSNFRVRVVQLREDAVYTLFGGGTEIYRPAGVAVTADGEMVFAADTANVKIRGVKITLPSPIHPSVPSAYGEPSAAPTSVTVSPLRRAADGQVSRRVGKDYWSDGSQMDAPYRYKVAGEIEELHIRHAMTAVIMFMLLACLGAIGIVVGALWQRRNALLMLRNYQASLKEFKRFAERTQNHQSFAERTGSFDSVVLDIPIDEDDASSNIPSKSNSRSVGHLLDRIPTAPASSGVQQVQSYNNFSQLKPPIVRRANSTTWPSSESEDTRPMMSHQRSVDKLSTVFRRGQS